MMLRGTRRRRFPHFHRRAHRDSRVLHVETRSIQPRRFRPLRKFWLHRQTCDFHFCKLERIKIKNPVPHAGRDAFEFKIELIRGRSGGLSLCGFGLLRRHHADIAAVLALVLKQHHAVNEREQRVVFAPAYVDAGLMTRAALANQDRTRVHQLAAKALHSQPLPLRIAAVYGGAAAFFMCNEDIPLS